MIGWLLFRWRFRRAHIDRTETACVYVGDGAPHGITAQTTLTILDFDWRHALVEVRRAALAENAWADTRPWKAPLGALRPAPLHPLLPPPARRFDAVLGRRLTGRRDA